MMAAEFTEEQIKAMIFGLEEEDEKDTSLEYPCNKEGELKATEVLGQLPPRPAVPPPPPPPPLIPLHICGTELPHPQLQTLTTAGRTLKKKKTIPRPCPVPECKEKIVANIWNHLFQTHKASGRYTEDELREFLKEAKRRVPTRKRPAVMVEGWREEGQPKRRGWMPLEEAMLTDHFSLVESRQTPTLDECQQFLVEFSKETLFMKRNKKDIQDKCRTIIKQSTKYSL